MLKLTYESLVLPQNFTGMVEYLNGTKEWYQNGKLHRDNGPAVEGFEGSKYWYKNNELHREDGPAVEWADGTYKWYQNDKLNKDDGPAIKYSNGTVEYWRNGKLHREDGPAIEYSDSDGEKEYWLDGIYRSSEEEYKLALEKLKPVCNDKIVVIDGKQYKLVLI